MKSFLVIFVLGALAGAAALYYYQNRRDVSHLPEAAPAASTDATPRPSVLDHARDTAIAAKDAVAHKLSDWDLSSEQIKADLQRTGEVVRTKARSAGESIGAATSKARVVAVINAKYTLDKDLSARTIDVDFNSGRVTLSGTVATHELIGRAIALALETEGVTEVKSSLTVRP